MILSASSALTSARISGGSDTARRDSAVVYREAVGVANVVVVELVCQVLFIDGETGAVLYIDLLVAQLVIESSFILARD